MTPPSGALIVTETSEVTNAVLTVKLAELAPGRTFTVFGTLATDGLLLESETTAPCGATVFKVSVPIAVLPLCTVLGERESDDTAVPELLEGVTVMKPLV